MSAENRTLLAGVVIVVSGLTALYVSTFAIRGTKAQNEVAAPGNPALGPNMNSGVPAPPTIPAMNPAQMQAPPSSENPPQPPPPTLMNPHEMVNQIQNTVNEQVGIEEERNRKALEATEDPGLRTSNPDGFIYDPTAGRDPFLPPKDFLERIETSGTPPPTLTPIHPVESLNPITPVAKLDPLLTYYLRELNLIGILWDVNDPRAMVRTPDNRVFTIRLRMKVGRENAVVAAIREKEVIVIQPDQQGDYKKGEPRSLRMKN